MANKKFYYRNKNKKPQSQNNASAGVLYTAEQLALPVQEMGLSDLVCDLLLKNRINSAGDLVMRTDRDMYKVQGFNKKMLFEVKDALKSKGMAFRVEAPKPPQQPKGEQNENAPKAQKPAQKQNNHQKQSAANEKEVSSKFGLADRRTETKPKQQQSHQQPQRPQKLTEPLPIEEWRKFIKGGKWGFSDGFKTVIPPMYDEVFSFKEELASVEIDGKCGYIDSQNNIVIPFDYDMAMSFSEGLAMVAKGEKCGYINKENEVVIPFDYDAATAFEGGESKVKKDGKWATLTKDNKLTWI